MLELADKDIKSYNCIILYVQNVLQRHKSFKNYKQTPPNKNYNVWDVRYTGWD